MRCWNIKFTDMQTVWFHFLMGLIRLRYRFPFHNLIKFSNCNHTNKMKCDQTVPLTPTHSIESSFSPFVFRFTSIVPTFLFCYPQVVLVFCPNRIDVLICILTDSHWAMNMTNSKQIFFFIFCWHSQTKLNLDCVLM